MKIEKFEDILAWQKARYLTMGIYNQFRNCHYFSFRDQIQRAAVSIMNNIAEGFERRGDNELKHFLFIAKGSSAEIRSMLYVGLELKYITQEQYNRFNNLSCDISKLLSGFIKSL